MLFSVKFASTSSEALIGRYAVVEWYGAALCDRKVVGSTPASGCCVPTPAQRAIPPGLVNEYQ